MLGVKNKPIMLRVIMLNVNNLVAVAPLQEAFFGLKVSF
jgi:hypothetical protein